MRKQQKEQISNILTLLEQVHREIYRLLEKAQTQQVMQLLVDCQDAAIAIGTQIEKTEGIGFKTVGLLETYCEQVYMIYESLSCQKRLSVKEVMDTLNQLFVQITNSFNDDIPIRKEVVFLPYKASMWDSLESVWKAADEDPDCDAYVIPIPYYDRRADGSFGEMHYEGDLYPQYVPVTNYKEFDLEEHKPDMIYIHNPYDEYNRVTSVHPDFYSKKLKEYTENLVYIPYFLLREVDSKNDEQVQAMAHFVLTPGVLNSDKTIVQSENMKQVYVNVLAKKFGENSRENWENRIDGSGSPKFDKLTNTRKEDLQIPKEWQKIIRKPNGSWKKVIFYNTSLSAFLQHWEVYLDKVEDVLRIFKENKDEVTLLWRPHPLMLSTIEAMRLDLKSRYLQIVQKYQSEGWGIYDESADLERAIVMSDGYYGDESSVVELCQKVEIPIMIQNLNEMVRT